MKQLLPRKRTIRILTLLAAFILVLGAGYAGARHVAWPWFKHWREGRANAIARDYLAKGDYANALVAARKTLGYNSTNTDAWKLAVEITEKQNSPQAIYYQQRLAAAQPTLENKLEHIRLAVKYRAYANALETINAAGAEAAKSAEFNELAALVTQRTGNLAKAKYYLINLVTLQPDNRKARLDLAQVRLLDPLEDDKPATRAEIKTIADTDPALRARALSLLLADAIDHHEETAALPLAQQLDTPSIAPTPTNNSELGTLNSELLTQLLIAEAYRNYAPDRYAPYIAQLEKTAEAETATDRIIPIANFLTTHAEPAETRRWLDTLPDKLRATEPIQTAHAYALLALNDFASLETYLRPLKWKENEFIRQSLLARAARERNDHRAFNESWQLALIEAANNPRKIQYLLAQTNTWNWPDQKNEVLWKKFTLDPADQNTRAQLATWELSKGNTLNLNRLFARITETTPDDLEARNDYAYTSLLLNLNTDRARRDAADTYKAAPANPYYATTYALSLYKQNQPAEALRVMDTLGAAALITPERNLIRAVILIANGRIDEGTDQAAHINLAALLPEERNLYTEVTPLIARARRAQAATERLATLAQSSEFSVQSSESGQQKTEGQKPALSTLNPELRTLNFPGNGAAAQLAARLYAARDYAALAEILRADPWPENDYLRLALLACAQRNLQRESDARDTWRIALITAANAPARLAVLEDLCARWNWPAERIEILNRILQRDPQNQKAFDALSDAYTKTGQTADLARIYALRVESASGSSSNATAAALDTKIHLAYYSLLTDTNTARAHVLAKEAYEAAPANPAAIKTYAFSLYKQSHAADGWRIIAALPDCAETGCEQLSFIKAILAARQNDLNQARAQLATFDPKSALPEETALADTLTRTLALASKP